MKLAETRLLVDDFAGALAFYRDVLGLTVTFEDEDIHYASLAAGESTIALYSRSAMAAAIGVAPVSPRGDRVVLAFSVDDTDVAVAALRARGVTVVAEPTDRPEWGGMRTAHLRDLEGNLIEIYHQIESVNG